MCQSDLPSPLTSNDPLEWLNRRRGEIRDFYERELYGALPELPERFSLRVLSRKSVFQNRAERLELLLTLGVADRNLEVEVLGFLPKNAPGGRSPAFVALNFAARCNAFCVADGDVLHADCDEAGKGVSRWNFELLVNSGYAVFTAPRNSFFFDDATGGFDGGVNGLYNSGQRYRAISAWAFGMRMLGRAALAFPEVDPRRLYLHGHSRLGKTALWTAANAPEFAGVVSNDSGCCGAALFRGKGGERIQNIGKNFPHWFVPDFPAKYAGRDDELSFDQHFLLALAAPRPLLVVSASEDAWADPKNEFRALRAVDEVYRIFGGAAPENRDFPVPEQRCFGRNLGYFLRGGKHDVTDRDWQAAIAFFDGAHA